jgi:iron-sulfur cluster assembly protein
MNPTAPASTSSTAPAYKIGNEKFCRVTESAAAKVLDVLEKTGYRKKQTENGESGQQSNGSVPATGIPEKIEGALRVAVVGGGCSGLQYKMDIVPGPANRDIVVPSHGVYIVIDPKSALFVSGSELDYSSDEQKGGFKVTNPNATAHCSCGESFSA